MSNKVLKFIQAKGNNKRIGIYLMQDKEGYKAFRVVTKTLASFKERKILKTDNLYSIETFAILQAMMELFLEDSEVKNKILLKELSPLTKFRAEGDLNSFE